MSNLTLIALRKTSCERVVIIGPSLDNKGGIATVEVTHLKYWYYKRYDAKHIATMANGSVFRKLWLFLRALGLCLTLLLFWKPHIVHIHFATGASFYRKTFFILLAKLFSKNLILHCHAYNFDMFYQRHTKLGQKFIRRILECADYLLVVAEQWQVYFETLGLNVPMHTLYNPAPYVPPAPQKRNSGKVVLSLGRLGERKGTFDILNAIPHTLALHPEAEFWFGGDGDVEQVSKLIASKPWRKQVRLLGWIRGRDKEKVFAQASIFLLPSYQEGLPMAILEAMAHGLPVISTPVGGIPEMVTDGETGFLVNPGDVEALAQKTSLLLGDVTLREKMGFQSCKAVATKFEVHRILEQLYAIYEEIMS